jgi:hypothetical protein
MEKLKLNTSWRRFWSLLVALLLTLIILNIWIGRGPMKLYEHRTITGEIKKVWSIATDVNRWPEWDPHEETGKIYGPFEVGTRAHSKPRGGPAADWVLTEVTKFQSWSLLNKMFIGTLEVHNRYTQLHNDKVKCEKEMLVSGWILRALFKLHFEAETRKDMQATWIALEREISLQEK